MKIFFGADHGGFELKEELKTWLSANNDVTDCGTFSTDSIDYPDIAATTAKEVVSHPDSIGILICGTGIGISIAANKVDGIRAALCWNEATGALARQHNNANILCLGGRQLSVDEAKKIVSAFLSAQFEGGRHERRVEKIMALEQ